ALQKGIQLKPAAVTPHPLSVDMQRSLDIDEFRLAQLNDPSLETCWKLCDNKEAGFVKNALNQLLFRETVIGGFKISQLVLPQEKREKVMQTGHDSEWASHYASVKTLQRIQAHFFWPEMRSQIDRYCRSCSLCQKHSRKTKLDRIPISPMLRSDVAFDKVNV